MILPSELVNQVVELQPLAQARKRVWALLNAPDKEAGGLSALLDWEPAMAARLLRLANSDFYGRASEVRSLEQARHLLGEQQVQELAAACCFRRTVREPGNEAHELSLPVWRRSVRAASLARLMAEQLGLADPGQMHTLGLLHRLGHRMLEGRLPEGMEELRALAAEKNQCLEQQQRACLGFDHAEVAAELLAAWSLPAALHLPMRWYTRPAQAERYMSETAVLHAAVALASASETLPGDALPALPLDPLAWEICGLEEQELRELLRRSDQDMLNAARALALPGAVEREASLAQAC